MNGAKFPHPPSPNPSSWHGAQLSTGTTLPYLYRAKYFANKKY